MQHTWRKTRTADGLVYATCVTCQAQRATAAGRPGRAATEVYYVRGDWREGPPPACEEDKMQQQQQGVGVPRLRQYDAVFTDDEMAALVALARQRRVTYREVLRQFARTCTAATAPTLTRPEPVKVA